MHTLLQQANRDVEEKFYLLCSGPLVVWLLGEAVLMVVGETDRRAWKWYSSGCEADGGNDDW